MPGIGPLADLERAKQDILYNAARVIHNLACHPMNKGPMIDQKIGVVEPLVEAALKEPPNDYESKLLLANDDDARRLRLMALQTLASLANADGEGADLSLECCGSPAYDPAAHATHAVDGSESKSAVPAAHCSHVVDPAAEYVPAAHSSMMLVPLHAEPAGHLAQFVRVALVPPDVNEPSGHGSAAAAPWVQ